MADMRTRAWPCSVSTSMESPSFTFVTVALTSDAAWAYRPPSGSRQQQRHAAGNQAAEPRDRPTTHRTAS